MITSKTTGQSLDDTLAFAAFKADGSDNATTVTDNSQSTAGALTAAQTAAKNAVKADYPQDNYKFAANATAYTDALALIDAATTVADVATQKTAAAAAIQKLVDDATLVSTVKTQLATVDNSVANTETDSALKTALEAIVTAIDADNDGTNKLTADVISGTTDTSTNLSSGDTVEITIQIGDATDTYTVTMTD